MIMEEYFDEIEAFLNNEMSSKEVEAFKKRVDSNIELKKAFFYHKLADKAIQYTLEDQYRQDLQKIKKQNGPLKIPRNYSRKLRLRKWVAVAASLFIGVLGVTLIYAQLNFSNKVLLEEHFEAPTGVYIRSENNQKNEALMKEALMAFFKDYDYPKALDLMKQIPESDINFDFAQYYVACCQFKLRNYEDALKHFNQILETQNFPNYVEQIEVEWNQMLANLALGNFPEFEDSINNIIARDKIPDYYKEQSVKLKKDANHFLRYFILD